MSNTGVTNTECSEDNSTWRGGKQVQFRIAKGVSSIKHIDIVECIKRWQYLVSGMEEIFGSIAQLETEHVRFLCVVGSG